MLALQPNRRWLMVCFKHIPHTEYIGLQRGILYSQEAGVALERAQERSASIFSLIVLLLI